MAKLFVVSSEHPDLKETQGAKAFPTATLAKAATSQFRKEGYDSEIEQVETPKDLGLRETACALFNRDGWVGTVEVIQELKGIKKNAPKSE